MEDWNWEAIVAQARLNFDSCGGADNTDARKLMAVARLWAEATNTTEQEGNQFAVSMAEYELWLLSLNSTQDVAILGLKCGLPPRKCLDLFNDVLFLFGHNVRVDRPFTMDHFRPILDAVGIPHKPFHTAAIEEEICEALERFIQPTEAVEQNEIIPKQFQTLPMQKAEAARLYRPDLTNSNSQVRALNTAIKKRKIACIEITRQSFVFDKRQLRTTPHNS